MERIWRRGIGRDTKRRQYTRLYKIFKEYRNGYLIKQIMKWVNDKSNNVMGKKYKLLENEWTENFDDAITNEEEDL